MTISQTTSNAGNDPDRWQPPFLTLPIHGVIRHQLELGLKGVESTLLVGPKGVGKSHAVTTLLKPFERQALHAEVNGQTVRKALFYQTALAHGTKTVLTDIYRHLDGGLTGKRTKQDWTPTQFIEQIVGKTSDEKIRLIMIDEAQLINPLNMEHLRELNDVAEQRGSSLRLFLIGHVELIDIVRKTGQLGERFQNVTKFPSLSATDVAPHLIGFHPDLPTIQQELGEKDWAKLVKALFSAARSSFRRLTNIIENAHELAAKRGAPMTAKDLWLAIDKLPTDDLL